MNAAQKAAAEPPITVGCYLGSIGPDRSAAEHVPPLQ